MHGNAEKIKAMRGHVRLVFMRREHAAFFPAERRKREDEAGFSDLPAGKGRCTPSALRLGVCWCRESWGGETAERLGLGQRALVQASAVPFRLDCWGGRSSCRGGLERLQCSSVLPAQESAAIFPVGGQGRGSAAPGRRYPKGPSGKGGD